MFIATLFTRPKIRSQQKCPSIDEWVKVMINKHSGALCSL
jgi:hypothetical protein